MIAAFQEWTSAWLQAVVKAWTDPSFKNRLLENPRDALTEFHYTLPPMVDLQVIDCSDPNSDPNHPQDATPTANFDVAAFEGKVRKTLRIPLLPAPRDLADGIITLAKPGNVGGGDCVCATW